MLLPSLCPICCCATAVVLVVQGTHRGRAAAVTQKQNFLGLGDHWASWSIFWSLKGDKKVEALCKGGFSYWRLHPLTAASMVHVFHYSDVTWACLMASHDQITGNWIICSVPWPEKQQRKQQGCALPAPFGDRCGFPTQRATSNAESLYAVMFCQDQIPALLAQSRGEPPVDRCIPLTKVQ